MLHQKVTEKRRANRAEREGKMGVTEDGQEFSAFFSVRVQSRRSKEEEEGDEEEGGRGELVVRFSPNSDPLQRLWVVLKGLEVVGDVLQVFEVIVGE